MLLHTFTSGDELHFYQKSLIISFKGKRNVLSTGPSNGGYTEHLTHVFNHDAKPGSGMACTLKAPTYEEHMQIVAEEIGLKPETTTGISTAATMDHYGMCSASYENTTVTAVITGGIGTNGGRVGDPASWDEERGKAVEMEKPGTINIMLFIDADLPAYALTRALVTCTEAKTAAIQELLAPSRYSMGLATGSGTDGTIICTNAESELKLTNTGKHSKLGELIGITVKTALKETFAKQANLTAESQHNILKRVDRFGITLQSIWEEYKKIEGSMEKPTFVWKLEQLAVEDNMVIYTSLYAHLLDQLMWDLISIEEALTAGNTLISILRKEHGTKEIERIQEKDGAIETMISDYKKLIIELLNN